MSADLQYNDGELQRLFDELDVKQRIKALKGAFRREANRVRKQALTNLRGSIRSDKDLEKGVRAVVMKRKAGFSVTIGTKVMKGRYKGKRNGVKRYGRAKKTWTGFAYHTNRQGKEKPVLIWAEGGTKWRRTKSKQRFEANGKWRTAGTHRGFMKRYGFMAKTLEDVKGSVTENLHTEVINSVKQVAKKHGCN